MIKIILNKIYTLIFHKCLYHDWTYGEVEIPFNEESKKKFSYAKLLGHLNLKHRKCGKCLKEECLSINECYRYKNWKKYIKGTKLSIK